VEYEKRAGLRANQLDAVCWRRGFESAGTADAFCARCGSLARAAAAQISEARLAQGTEGWRRQARAVAPVTLEDTLEAYLSHEDMLDVLRLDLLVNGRWRALPETPEVWLAVEVAAVLDEGDVARAWRRATLLWQAGYRAVPAVAGERITPDGETSARIQNVAIVQDGRTILPPEALAT